GRSVDRRALLLDRRSVARGWVGLAFLLFSSSYVQRQKWSFLDIVFSETGATVTLHRLPGGAHVTFQKRLFCNEFSHHPLHSLPPPSGEAFSFFVCVALSGNESRVRYDVFRASRVFDCPSVCHPKIGAQRCEFVVDHSFRFPLVSLWPSRTDKIGTASFSIPRDFFCRTLDLFVSLHCPLPLPITLPRRRRLYYVSRA
ncbi:unnamed protein product, partial [Ixodes pacificus]